MPEALATPLQVITQVSPGERDEPCSRHCRTWTSSWDEQAELPGRTGDHPGST